MATFKETREILLASYASNIITIEEYALLFEENSSNNLDFPYYNYPPFNLESQSCETAVPVASKIKISLKQFLRKQCVNWIAAKYSTVLVKDSK